jgi:hypothetical protein
MYRAGPSGCALVYSKMPHGGGAEAADARLWAALASSPR